MARVRRVWLAMASLVFFQTNDALASDPTGLWQSESGLSRYEVRPCGPGICVKIVWIVEGPGVRDAHNPNPALRSRPVMGIDIISSSRAVRPHRWEGRIYNFKNGQTYSGWAQLESAGTLRVAGCIVGGLICLSQTMTRMR